LVIATHAASAVMIQRFFPSTNLVGTSSATLLTSCVSASFLFVLAAPPSVYTGPAAIHAMLLQQLRINVWHLALHSLDAEMSQLLGLPARLQPSKAAARQQQQQQQPAAAGAAAASGMPRSSSSISNGGSSSSSSRLGSSNQQHVMFYAMLSDLVLQAVVGSAATAGEDAVLEQQQQQQQQGPERSVGSGRGATPNTDGGSMSEGILLGEIDVGAPWERAAAAAAAATAADAADAVPAAEGQRKPDGTAPAGGSGAPVVLVEPQLLSLRPLVLEHLLITQLGHMASFSQRNQNVVMAAMAYAATARHMYERQRQRQEQQQQQAAGAAAGSGVASMRSGDSASLSGSSVAAPASSSSSMMAAAAGSSSVRHGVNVFGSSVSFVTTISRWLAHSSSRDLVRAKVDEQVR
jgi:hypothetical protein